MSKLILCTGAYAQEPYDMKKIGRKVHSVEELCFCISQNAFMLDMDDFDAGMADWISGQCGLKKLGADLQELLRRKCSAAAFAGTILEYVRYNTEEEIHTVEEIMRSNAGMNVYEKKMARADYLLKNGKYHHAFEEYDELLRILPEIDREMRARIEHNKGCMYAEMFDYESAATMFKCEYADDPTEDAYLCYLAAMRMNLPERDYVAFIGADKEAYSFSMKLEQKMNQAVELYDVSDEKHFLDTLTACRTENNAGEYYSRLGETAVRMKEEYRDLVTDNGEKRR